MTFVYGQYQHEDRPIELQDVEREFKDALMTRCTLRPHVFHCEAPRSGICTCKELREERDAS